MRPVYLRPYPRRRIRRNLTNYQALLGRRLVLHVRLRLIDTAERERERERENEYWERTIN